VKHHLSFDHPVSMLMFWGIDKSTIQKVTLQLNGHAIYDGPIEPLERVKEARGLGHIEPVVLFFSSAEEGTDSAYQSTVNFSRMDSVTMLICTRPGMNAEPVDETVRYYAVAMHPLRIADGSCTKIFTGTRCKDMFKASCGDPFPI